ncbi:MAG: precorrin-3B C(17)-methyltransferase [Peptococcaceae bacterium]|jgi:precorrin-3B C17-methyltransferase|nr:precorrin-3B C(17)-methyltransferase [Peptococcaceae bacterium]MDH7525787.1 precorrin-3B C(17)-methyltransferase [Peptococcaceae bacterium]
MEGKKGRVFAVGLGPGSPGHMTGEVLKAIQASEAVIGYHVYLELIEGLLAGKEVFASGMRRELERCEKALALAREGKTVSLVSGGDPGVYGMAGPLLEINGKQTEPVEIEVVPGVTAACMAGAVLGAPLMHDTALISLSDLLTPREMIKKRLRLAAEGDFVTVLYNPGSASRSGYVKWARDIFLEYRKKETPVGIVRNAARENQEKWIATLGELADYSVDMFTLVIIGNSRTYCSGGRMITPRGYAL